MQRLQSSKAARHFNVRRNTGKVETTEPARATNSAKPMHIHSHASSLVTHITIPKADHKQCKTAPVYITSSHLVVPVLSITQASNVLRLTQAHACVHAHLISRAQCLSAHPLMHCSKLKRGSFLLALAMLVCPPAGAFHGYPTPLLSMRVLNHPVPHITAIGLPDAHL